LTHWLLELGTARGQMGAMNNTESR